jgi:hypothetical protein
MRTDAETRELCYKAIGVDPNDVANFPKLAFAIRSVGGQDKAIEYLRSAGTVPALRFLAVYDDLILPEMVRRLLPIEAFCVAAKITFGQFVTDLSSAVRQVRQFEGSVRAAEAHPKIVEVSSALAEAGDIDHAVLNMKHMGFLPLPKGSQVSVNVNANANANATAQSATVLAPSPENTIRGLVNRFNLPVAQQAALLEAKEVVPLVMERERVAEMIEVEYEDDDNDV